MRPDAREIQGRINEIAADDRGVLIGQRKGVESLVLIRMMRVRHEERRNAIAPRLRHAARSERLTAQSAAPHAAPIASRNGTTTHGMPACSYAARIGASPSLPV